MRRKDREITDTNAIYDLLRHAEYGTLSLSDGEVPYAVPMSVGFFLEDGVPYLCWHGAREGKKAALLRRHPKIVYSCVSECVRDFAPERLHWSFFYQSAVATGTAQEVFDLAEKSRLLHRLLEHYGEKRFFEIPRPMLETLGVWKCRIDHVTGKAHR
ncbi:MAG: pyridoxamine 5'-phosphate oxidase family protein [Planctomycetia bacterium]|nr:pyridoxamine 5'-phosphate oxidase family protein [Planctomycetia bacterium]